ncbi:MAG: hypothetical protein M1355_02385 [Patescibacteria group bacterium]|nr:hypothetical protein [Patescibacteria group bacterium]
MKFRTYLIFFIILVVFSSGSASIGYFYAMKKAELDKEAAVKGAVYDAKEELSKQAVEEAKKVVGENLQGDTPEMKKIITDFFGEINNKNYENAWYYLTSDYQKTLVSSYGLKREFSNLGKVSVDKIEFRTSGDLSTLYSVTLNNNSDTKNPTINYFIKLIFEPKSNNWRINDIQKAEE